MLHLAIICMVCAVLAPIEGTALTGVNNNKSNIFCHVDERDQRQRGKLFPGLYNVDVENCFDCAGKQITDRTRCISYDKLTNQCQFSRTLCSFKNKFPDRQKRDSDSQSDCIVERRNICRLFKNKGRMLIKKLARSDAKKLKEPKHSVGLTAYERNKLRHLKRVGRKRKKRRTRKSHLDKVEVDEDLDMNKRIEKLVKRIALENMKTEENSVVSPTTESVSTRLGEDSTKGIAFPFFNNIKQIFRFSKEYFNSKRDSQEKRDVTIPERNWNTITESENPEKSARLRRNVPRHFIHNRLGGCPSTLNTPNRVAFSALKRKRRRRKRDRRHHRPRLDLSSKQRWPLFSHMYSSDYNGHDSRTTGSQTPENESVVTTVLPSFHTSSSINHINNFSTTNSETLTDRQGNDSIKGSNKLDDYNNRNVFHRGFGKPIRQEVTNRYESGHKRSGFPHDRKRLRSGRYLKIRHALRSYIHHNNDWRLRQKILMDRKKRCEAKCNSMPHKCWRSAPLLCIPYIRKGQDELLKYIIKILQEMLGKPMPRKIDIFEKIKFKPCNKTPAPTFEDIVPGGENESSSQTTVTTCSPTTTTPKPTLPSSSPSPPSSSPTPLPPLVLYETFPATESASSSNTSSVETVTTCVSSFTCSVQMNVCSPSTTTCPPPPSSTTYSPTTPTIYAPASQNTYAVLIIGPSTDAPPTAGSELMVTVSGTSYSNYGYSTETPLSPGTESSAQTPPQSQTLSSMTIIQITMEDDRSSDVIPSENSVNTPSSNYPGTSTPSNKVTPCALAQGSTTVCPHSGVAPTQEIRPPTTQNKAPWYVSESPLEKAEIFTFTALDCTSSSDPDSCYKYYQSFTPPSSNEKPQFSNPRQMENERQDNVYNMLLYETDKTPTQHRPPMMGSGTMMPLEFDLSYNDKAKPCKDFYESDTMTDYSSQPNPKDEKSLREKLFEESREKFKLGEDENLFPGDPYAYRYTETTDRFWPRMMRPKFYRKNFPTFMRKSNRKMTPNYDYVDEPPSRKRKIYDERYNRYSPEMSERDFDERIRKTPKKNQKRGKREIIYRDSYPESKNSDNYDDYFDDSNYNDQYPENLLLPDSEKIHWAKKREEDQNSSTPGTYALFSELAEIAKLAPNETEKAGGRSANISSPESANKTVTHPQTSPQMGCINKLEQEQRIGYDNSPNPTVSILSAGHTTTLKQIPATTSDEATTASSITTTLDNKGSTHALKSNEVQKAQIVDSGKPDKELGSNHDLEAGEEQIITTLKTASIVKGPRKLFTKPAPKVYTKVYPDSLPNELETNETPTTSTTPKTDKTTVVQTLAAPDVRLQLLAVCEGYLEIVKLIKAQNQSLEEELDTDLSQYCENIISQSFNLQADNVIIKSKKLDKSSPSMTTTAQTASANSNKLVSKRRSCDRYRAEEDGSSHQDLRAKVVVDILRSPVYKKDLAAYVDQNNIYPKGRKTKRMRSQNLKIDDRGMRKRKGRAKKDFSNSKVGLRNKRKNRRKNEDTKKKISKKKISEEEMELLHLLRQRKRALLSWLSDPKENEINPNDLEETEYLDDDEYYTITADTTEDSGTITTKGDQETSESTTKTTFYTNDTIFPVYAKQYGYDRGGELREVEVLWRRVNEDTHEKKIFKNMSVLALLLTSTMAPYMKRKESSRLVGDNVYEADEMSEIQSNRDNRVGFVDPSLSFKEKPVTTSLPPPSPSTIYFISFKPDFSQCCVTTPELTTTGMIASSTTTSPQTTPTTTVKSKAMPTTEYQTEFETVQPNTTSKRNQTYIFMRKPDPSTIVGSPPNSTKGLKNSTHRMSRKLEMAKDFFQEYSIEFLNYAVYILPIMFTILFLMCCLCCFLQILNSRGGDRRKKKKKTLLCTEEDYDTTGDSEGGPKIRKKKKWKKSTKNGVDSENLENRRLRAFWNVLKMNSRGKQRGDIRDETSTPTEKRRSFLQFLKGKKEAVQPEELASLSYPPPCERDEISDVETRIRIEGNDNDGFDSEMKVPVRERTEVDERREIISLLEELKKIELENLEERKNKKSVCVQYMAQDEEKTVFKKPDIPSSYHVNKYFEGDPFPDKRFPFRDPNPEELHEDAQEFMELVPYDGEYIQQKSSSVRRSDVRVNRGGRCERFFKLFRGSRDGMNFTKSGNDTKSYIYTKYKNISTDTRDELMGGTHRNADVDMNFSDDVLDNFRPAYSFQRNRQTDIVDEMENLKRQLNKKKNVRLKDNGVLCRL